MGWGGERGWDIRWFAKEEKEDKRDKKKKIKGMEVLCAWGGFGGGGGGICLKCQIRKKSMEKLFPFKAIMVKHQLIAYKTLLKKAHLPFWGGAFHFLKSKKLPRNWPNCHVKLTITSFQGQWMEPLC